MTIIRWIGSNLTGLAAMLGVFVTIASRLWSHREHKKTERKINILMNGDN